MSWLHTGHPCIQQDTSKTERKLSPNLNGSGVEPLNPDRRVRWFQCGVSCRHFFSKIRRSSQLLPMRNALSGASTCFVMSYVVISRGQCVCSRHGLLSIGGTMHSTYSIHVVHTYIHTSNSYVHTYLPTCIHTCLSNVQPHTYRPKTQIFLTHFIPDCKTRAATIRTTRRKQQHDTHADEM